MPQKTIPSGLARTNERRERQRQLVARIIQHLDPDVPGWLWRQADTVIDDGGGYGVDDDRPDWLKAEDAREWGGY